jgi:hypothetical protein
VIPKIHVPGARSTASLLNAMIGTRPATLLLTAGTSSADSGPRISAGFLRSACPTAAAAPAAVPPVSKLSTYWLFSASKAA